MKLHENRVLFRDAILAASQQKGLREIFIEKDYWVTYILFHIFNSEVGNEIVFKGGTALLKCFDMIQRFSEDIDLVVLRNKKETGNQLKTKIRKISKCASNALPEIKVEGVTRKVGMVRKTAHHYTRIFDGHFGQIRDTVVIEATWLGNFEPYATSEIKTIIYDLMVENDQQVLIDQYEMNPFKVLVLSPKRTFCEKIMSLVRFSHTQTPIFDLRNKIRHIYDIHLMMSVSGINDFVHSVDFENMLLRVAKDDIVSFRNNNEWLAFHPAESIIFSEPIEVWNKIRSVYLAILRLVLRSPGTVG